MKQKWMFFWNSHTFSMIQQRRAVRSFTNPACTSVSSRFTYCWSLAWRILSVSLGFPCGSAGKESACNAGDLGSVPGLGRSPGKGKGYPLQYSGLENSMDYRVAKSWTRLSNFCFHFSLFASMWNECSPPRSGDWGTIHRGRGTPGPGEVYLLVPHPQLPQLQQLSLGDLGQRGCWDVTTAQSPRPKGNIFGFDLLPFSFSF